MASLADVLSEQEMTNWLKAWLAINITKTGLRDFVDKEVKSFQTSTIQSVAFNLRLPAITTCTCCLTANLLKCPTNKLCNKRKHNAVCKMHDTVSKQPRRCPNGICDAVREEIIKAHRYHSPSWNNTSAEQWASNHWELAKCYMPPDGYIAVSTFEETDFNGVISIILNCAIFDGQFSFSIAPQHPSPCCLLSKTRAIGKAVRHSSDCKVTSDDLCDYLLTLITLLSDSKVLVLDHSAQDAVRKLTQLQTEGLNISVAGVGQLLNDARESLKQAKQLSEESKTKLETYMQEYITKLDKRVHNLQEKSEKDFRERTQTCTENCKRELSKHLKNSVISTQKTQPLMNECGVEQNIEEFRQRLINYYTKNVTHISLSSLMPSHVKSFVEIYAAPKICRIETEKDGTRKKTEWIKTYKGIFHSVQTTGKHIILQGEPGKGKSTFSSKLVVDWCNACNCAPQRTEQESTFGDAESLREFRFVFHVALRESRKQRKVVEMIKKQIIDMLYDDDHDVEKAYKLLLTILTKEACLVVEDGLDEWSDPDGKLPLPILVAPCVVFITTRPWKMCDELLKTSLVDCLLEIKGVIDPFVLSKSVLECLIDTNLDEKYDTFRSYIFANELTELIKTPLLLTLIVCLWVENSFLAGSACEIYSLLLDSLLKKSNSEIAYFHSPKFRCFKNTKYLKTNIGFIKSLSKAAFHLLFSELKENTLVFNDIELSKYLTKFEKMLALRTGILTEKKLSTLSYRPSTCSFIHKSVQEFLAALHIASNEDLVDSDILQQFNNGQIQLMEISQVFKFTCGLSITAANRLSRAFKIYADHAMMNRNLLDSYSGQSLQELIITGYKEAKANNVPGEEIHLQLNNFYSNFEERDTDTLNCIVLKNLSNIQSLEFTSNYFFF
ncbi:uncharacterized protein LOC127838996 isoform X2 [Dreissena polymorpha]|uniref:NACHT domain-containing protein n=1 Tax=Dreissena polymorpha TaxID=45954 RepID=A0A9D4FPU6_DREPO|nr:uncharacterized protein LOC127838996 isoform X2 [Dreissena polymorpha]XP_052223102.1 uncharacterized protein LOC127838996 isoform X2 [Dreissena polymorpha]KAH3801088.1 hypothetical protein DPMN_154733 [Dreissena polymorpha]